MIVRRGRVMCAATAALLIALAGCSPTASPPEQGIVIDVLHQDWRHVPGIVADSNGLRVTAAATRIVEQDGSGGQPNPPLNLAGTHLVAPDDFSLRASFTDVTSDVTLAVYDSPPVIADEFRIEPAGLRLTLSGNVLRIMVFDGSAPLAVTDPRPAHDESVTVPDPDAELSVYRSGDVLGISSGGRTLSSLPLADVFGSGELWLGLSSEEGSFTVSSLTASTPGGAALATAGPVVADAEPSPDGLQALAARARPGFLIGAAVALGPLVSNADYANHVVGEFGALTPENAMKPQSLAPRQGEYTFEEADALLDLAESKGMTVHGHTIAFTEAMPRWMQTLPTSSE